MNRSLDPPQNNVRGDRWSPIWCSNAKIPRFLQNSAPPVANGAGGRSIGNKMLKLTYTYEGLSIGRTQKKTALGSCKNFLILLVFSEKILNTWNQQLLLILTFYPVFAFCALVPWVKLRFRCRSFSRSGPYTPPCTRRPTTS